MFFNSTFPNPSPLPPQPKAPEVPWSETDSAVHHLTEDTFDSFLEEHPSTLVMFYAPCECWQPPVCLGGMGWGWGGQSQRP